MNRLTIFFFSFVIIFNSDAQTINLNEDYIINDLRISQIKGNFDSNISFTLRPLHITKNGVKIDSTEIYFENYSKSIFSFFNNKINLKLLPINFNSEFSSHHPYNRNNGSLIPSRGYQHIISPGIFSKIGPISIQYKPEFLFSQNLEYDGFWDGHYDEIWAKRYNGWNHIDIPERFGETEYKRNLLGQSSVRINFSKLSLGISNENIWWGPSIRNSIMMSNHARGFKHITFNTTSPINTKIGSFEWQFVTGRLERSGYKPPQTDRMYAGTRLWIQKINQNGKHDDWRYFQGISLTYSPKWIDGLSIGFIRWVQMYSALVEGKYWWMKGSTNYFPLFSNLFRKNDKYVDYELQTDQAAGIFFRWILKKSKAEIYAEFHRNDASQNLRDLILDSEHSRALTVGVQKIFKSIKHDYLFSWEWTQLEQTAGRLLRNAGSWYQHGYVYHGYTNYGEVIGASIGPGSNSNYFSITRLSPNERYGIAFEVIDQDNDFYTDAFSNAQDFRRYWKDLNLILKFQKKFQNFWFSSNLIYSKSLNYQWELDDYAEPYYHNGRDVDNFHLNLKISYFFNL